MAWIVLFLAGVVWIHYGTSGLWEAGTLAAMVVAGFAVQNFLNMFWKEPKAERKAPAREQWQSSYHRANPLRRGFLSPNSRRSARPYYSRQMRSILPPRSVRDDTSLIETY